MPGKCKFQIAWLAKDIYKDWLVKDPQDIQLARCRACCKAIKLQTMGEAALTSHAAGTGHKAAVRKLVEGNILVMNVGDNVNGYGSIKDEDEKEHVALSLHLNSLDRMTGSDPPPPLEPGILGTGSTSHNAALQEMAFATSFIDLRGIVSHSSLDCGVPTHSNNHNSNHHHQHQHQHPPRRLLHPLQQPPPHHPSPSPVRRYGRRESPVRDVALPPMPPHTPRFTALLLPRRDGEQRDGEQRDRVEALEEERAEVLAEQQQQQQQPPPPPPSPQVEPREQMERLEWERRMGVLAWEQEVLREKGRAARQKARAYRMKRRYYGAKLRRMGQDAATATAPPSSSSSSSSCSSDDNEWGRGQPGPREEGAL